MAIHYRAPEERQRIRKEVAYRDTRRFSEYLRVEIPKWDVTITILLLLLFSPFYYPLAVWVSIPGSVFLALWSGSSRINRSLPMKLPSALSNQTDFNDHKPGQPNKFNNASGTILLGNLRKGLSEVWCAGKDLLTHMLLIGTTGSGKTEALVSLAASTAFCMGGGVIYVDAKAAPKLIFQFATLAKIFGRDDDIRIINYLTGNRTLSERSWERLSNTANPFAQGPANTAVQTLTALLPSGGGDNQYFLDRAIAMLRTLMPALVELRDKGVLNIYPSLIGEYISIKKFMELAKNHIVVNGVPYENVSLSDRTLMVLKTFLKSLPGFNSNLAPEKQAEEVHRQFGFAEGYFARTLANLAGTYGHIYETELAEADFIDIIMHNRILVVLVPAMEQASEERAALGKVVLSSIRTAMSQGLGGRAEGDKEDVLDSLPIDLRIPTMIIIDEYPEVAVEGFAVTATQGRGLGMSAVFAGQDMAGFVRASELEADMIFGNTRLKVLMSLEDPEITWRKFKELAGSMKVAEGAGWEQDAGGIDTYKTNISASIREVDRIDMQDLKEQTEGEAHLFERANIHRVQLFHHGIDDKNLVKNFRINRMLKIKPPDPRTLDRLQLHVKRNIEMEKAIDEKASNSVPHIATLDRLGTIQGLLDDKKWPWRFIDTLEEGSVISPIIEANNSPTTIESGNMLAPVQQEELELSKMFEALNDSQQDIYNERVTTNNPSEISVNQASDFEGMDMELLMEPIPVPSKDVPNSKYGNSSEVDNEFKNRISNTLAKAENHWIFMSVSNEDGISRTQRIFNDMVEMNTLSGQPAREAKQSVLDAIEGVTEAVVYPSQEIESKPEDVDDLWAALNSMKDE